MCWFITLGVKQAAVASLLQLGHDRSGLKLYPAYNPHVAALFPKDDLLYLVIPGMCSCSLVPQIEFTITNKLKAHRKRYRKQGWSEAKIARGIESTERPFRQEQQSRNDLNPEGRFRQSIADKVRQFGGVRIFAHFYNGELGEEAVKCDDRRLWTLEEFLRKGVPEEALVYLVQDP